MVKALSIAAFVLILVAVAVRADTITVQTNYAYSTEYTTPAPVTLYGSNSVFAQYGYRTTNESGTIYTWGLSASSEMDKCPPEQMVFDFTGTNFELILNGFPGNGSGNYSDPYFSISDGTTNVSYTNSPLYTRNNSFNLFSIIRFANNITHHITLRVKGGFVGINCTNGTFSSTTITTKPNLLIDESDSYGEGFNPCVTMSEGGSSFWFDGFLWQLMNQQPNLVVVPASLSGTGFYTTNGSSQPYWLGRDTNDVAALYTNAMASGLYNHIFICANGTINDMTQPTNAVYQNATNVLGTFKTLCPQATVFLVGNWLGAGGRTTPGSDDYALEWAMTNAAATEGVPCFDPIPANLKNAGNYNVFYPAGTDSVHPSAAGYLIYSTWLQTNLAYTFGATYTNPGVLPAIYVTNYGAMPDLTNFTCATVSNSVVVGTPYNWNANATIGKCIEIFRAGPQVTYQVTNLVVLTNDILAFVTNVSNGTNLLVSVTPGVTGNFYCTVATNSAPGFQAAINAAQAEVMAGTSTNPAVYIPQGSYFLAGTNVLNPNYVMTAYNDGGLPAVTITTGGLNLIGLGTNAYLYGVGAGMNHMVATNGMYPTNEAPILPMRNIMFTYSGPITNSQYATVWTNIVFDGGVTNGLQPYSYWTLHQWDGAGWDTSHHAIDDSDWSNSRQMTQYRLFANCKFQHWRGEMVIDTGSWSTNGLNDFENCIFFDGNASADNMYYGQIVNGCFFNQLCKVIEIYQQNLDLPYLYSNNVETNINGNGSSFYDFTVVGAVTNETEKPIIIASNTWYGVTGMNHIQFSSAENVTVVSNRFVGVADSDIVFTAIGAQPGYPSGGSVLQMTNFLISWNDFGGSGNPLSMDGYGVTNCTIVNNTNLQVHLGAGNKLGIVLSNNFGILHDGQYDVDGTNIQTGYYALDVSNYWVLPNTSPDGGNYQNTNMVSYGAGYFHILQNAAATFFCDTNGLTPVSSFMIVSNQSASTIPLYWDGSLTLHTNLATHTAALLTFTNGTWNPSPPVYVPPPILFLIRSSQIETPDHSL